MASTQTQGKGKKKNKEVTKVPLEEFNQMEAPHGHSIVSLKSLDWAETMADYEQPKETQIFVPTAPRSQRGPGIDKESLPNDPPFRVSLYNLPMAVDEKEVSERIFIGLDVIRVDITKSSTTVEFGSRDALYDALFKDGVSIKGKTINVCLYGESPPNYSDRYGGGRGGYGDRYGDRGSGGFGGSRMGDRYGDRPGGSFNRDRDSYSGFNRSGNGGYGQPRGGFGDRYERDSQRDTRGGAEPTFEREEPDNWRAAARPTVKPPAPPAPSYNNGARQPYVHPRQEQSYYPPTRHQQYPESSYQPRYQPHHNQSSNHMPPSQYNDRPGSTSRIINPAPVEERPKLVINKRNKPIDVDDISSVTRNEAIFGQAKPSSTPYEKMMEIEEKLRTVQVSEGKTPSTGGSQPGSVPGSAPRSRQISERSRE